MERLIRMSDDMTLQIEGVALTIPEFKELVDKDKTKTKELAKSELAFLWFLYETSNMKNPYREYPFDERKKRIREDIMPKDWKISKEFLAAMDRYQYYNYSAMSRLLDNARAALSKVNDYFTTFDINEKDLNGKPIYTIKDLMGNMANLSKVITGLKQLEDIVRAEQEVEDNSIRGGGQLGLLESGIIKVAEGDD